MGVKLYLTVVLICILIMISDIEHLFTNLLHKGIFLGEMSESFAHF